MPDVGCLEAAAASGDARDYTSSPMEPAPCAARQRLLYSTTMAGDRVLIVDDDELILKALARILEGAGFDAALLPQPRGGARRHRGRGPVVVISDYMMPAMDGIAFLKAAAGPLPGARSASCAPPPRTSASPSRR